MCRYIDMWARRYIFNIFYIEEYKNKLNLHHSLKLSSVLKVYYICKRFIYYQSIASHLRNDNVKGDKSAAIWDLSLKIGRCNKMVASKCHGRLWFNPKTKLTARLRHGEPDIKAPRSLKLIGYVYGKLYSTGFYFFTFFFFFLISDVKKHCHASLQSYLLFASGHNIWLVRRSEIVASQQHLRGS